jgi:iron complex outermembrane receptor protein
MLLLTITTKAQNEPCQANLRIILLDSLSQNPLHLADIQIHPEAFSKIDSNAHAIYNLNCATKYNLHINHLDCEHKDLSISIQSDSTIIVYLRHSENSLLPFTVKQKLFKPDANQINQLQIQRNKGQSVGYLMEQLNGVQLIKNGQGIAKPMVNGLYGNRLILLNSYSRLEGQNWGLDHSPELDPNIYQNISIIEGAKALRFGPDAFAAVIQMLPISVFKPKGKALEGEVNLTGISNGWGQQAHVHLGSKVFQKRYMYWQISGSAKQIGNYTSSQDRLSNTAQKEAQLTAQLGYKQKHSFYEFLASNYLAVNGLYTGAHVGNISDILLYGWFKVQHRCPETNC